MSKLLISCGFCGCKHNVGQCCGVMTYQHGQAEGESATVARIVEALRAEPWGADISGKTIVPSLGLIADWIERGDRRQGNAQTGRTTSNRDQRTNALRVVTMAKQFRDHCQYCGVTLPHAPYEDGIIECRNRLFDQVSDLETELDVHKSGVALDAATRGILKLTTREAARRAMALDGADAQALEGALCSAEKEIDQIRIAMKKTLLCVEYYALKDNPTDRGAFARQTLRAIAVGDNCVDTAKTGE